MNRSTPRTVMRMNSSKARSKLAVVVAALTVAVLALASCSSGGSSTSTGSDDSKPVKGGTIRAALSGDPQNLDMGLSSASLTIFVASNIFEGLFALDESNAPQPMLAKSYEVSDDGLTYTIPLRDGVPFQNGDILDSADVVASLQRWMSISSTGQQVSADLDSLKAPDANTVVIKLTRPRYSLISDLAFYVQSAVIMPEDIAKAAGKSPLTSKQVVGTGPYELEKYTAGESVKLKRFDDYAALTDDEGGLAGAKHAYADAIDYTFVTDASQRLNGLKTGQWDWVDGISADDVEAASADKSLTVRASVPGVVNTVVLNHNSSSAFASLDARRALNMVIDKKVFAKATFGPKWLWDPLTPAMVNPSNKAMFSDAGADIYQDYDPAEAKKLFAKAGIDGSRPIRIISTKTYPQFYQWAVLIQGELKKIGIEAKIATYDYPTVSEKVRSEPNSWDLSMTYFSGGVVSPAQIVWLTPAWPGEYRNADLDALLADYQKSTTPDEAKQVVEKIQTLVYDDLPAVQLGASSAVGVFSAKLHVPGDWTSFLWNSWLSK